MLSHLVRLADLMRRTTVVVLLMVAVGCMLAFRWREQQIGVGRLLDGRWWGYTTTDATVLLSRMSEDHRHLYAITELTLDVVFPATYAILFLLALHRLFPSARVLLVLPVLAAVADLVENVLIAWFAWGYPALATSLITIASLATVTKWWTLTILGLVFVCGLFRRWRQSTPPNAVQKLGDVLDKEREYVRLRRRHSSNKGVDPRDTLVGLSLSGGGIRSATTCLGMLQALSRLQLLPLVDYVSTVSGGGYIGSCLTSLLTLPRPNGSPIFSTEWASFPFNSDHREGRSQLDHLRTHGSFLVTRTGVLARETMRSVGYLLAGTLYHLSVALLALAIVALLYMAGILRMSPDLHDTLNERAPAMYLERDPAYEFAKPALSERKVYREAKLLERLDHKRGLIEVAAWQAANTEWGRFAVFGTVLYGAALSLWAFAFLRRRYRETGHPQPGESEDDARERSLLRRVGYSGLAATVVAFGVAWLFCPKYGGVLWLFIPAIGLFTTVATNLLLHALLPRFTEWWNRRFRSLWGAFQAISWYGFLVALMLGLFPLATYAFRDAGVFAATSGVVSLVVARFLTSRTEPATRPRRWSLPVSVRRWLLGVAIVAGVLLLLVAMTAAIVPDNADETLVAAAINNFFWAGVICAVMFGVLGWLVDANRVSPHYFYQDRLGETYLFTERREQGGVLRRARNSARMLLTELHGPAPAPQDPTRAGTAPYHLVSAAINLASSRDLTRKDRKSGYFLFSKYFCGSVHTGFRATTDYAKGETTLVQAMTISGAAASSGIGAKTFFAQAFATVLFNLRLGYWLPNPAKPQKKWKLYFWPRWLAREMFMRTNELERLVNVSDGGHTGDNVGIYPLLQRRCRIIIACDAERDSDLSFGSITEALRHAYIDLGIDVDIDFTMLRPDPETGMSRGHCAVGLIRYPPLSRFVRQDELPPLDTVPTTEEPLIGYLIYLKNSLTGDEPEPVLNYKSDHPAFPHETTADQFFDDAQFESYRALGGHIIENSLGPWVAEDAFKNFLEKYWPFTTPAQV